MTLTRFEFTSRVRPLMQVGVGSTVVNESAAVWDVGRWDEDLWNGDEPLWLDVSCDVIEVLSEQGRERNMDPFPVGRADITVDNASGWADPSTSDFDGVQHVGHIDLPGTTGNWVSTPSTGPLQVAGDLCLVAWIEPDDYTPSTGGVIVCKSVDTGDQRSYRLQLRTDGLLELTISSAGTAATANGHPSSEAITAVAGRGKAVAVAYDSNDGAGGRDAYFWQSDDDPRLGPVTWTALGTPFHGGAPLTIFPSSADLQIGARNNGTTAPFAGNISYVSVRSGIGTGGTVGGTEVFRFDGNTDLDGVAEDATSFVANSGHAMTVHHSGTPDTSLVSESTGTLISLRPGRGLRVGVDHVLLGERWLWRGFIDAIEPRDAPDDWSTVRLRCIDALGEAGRAKLRIDDEFDDGQLAHRRFDRTLDLISWPTTKRDVDTSAIRELYAADQAGQVIDILRRTAESEGGWCFGDNNGNVVLKARNWLLTDVNATVDATIGNVATGQFLFVQDPPGSGLYVYLGDPGEIVEDPPGSGLYSWGA